MSSKIALKSIMWIGIFKREWNFQIAFYYVGIIADEGHAAHIRENPNAPIIGKFSLHIIDTQWFTLIKAVLSPEARAVILQSGDSYIHIAAHVPYSLVTLRPSFRRARRVLPRDGARPDRKESPTRAVLHFAHHCTATAGALRFTGAAQASAINRLSP